MYQFIYFYTPMQAKLLQILFKQQYGLIPKSRNGMLALQGKMWSELVHLAKETVFGKAHGFREIKTLEDYKQAIPINSYENLEPYIAKMKAGEKDVLWPGRVNMFAKSSGTSNAKSKYIPLSKVSLLENHYRGGKNILSIFTHCFPEQNIFENKNVSVAGSFDTNAHGLKVGDLSSLLLDNLPYWVQMKRLPSKKNALLPNWEEKIEAISKEIFQEDVGSLSGVPSWNLILLQRIKELSQQADLSTVWPRFKLYMHGGVNFNPYRSSFEKLFGKDMVFLETYNASEGFFAIQDQFDAEENGMLLLCNHAVFYEFLPIAHLHEKNPQTMQLEEVEIGQDYALIITTKSGLWRYQIGDTIQFINLDPFRIKITGRVNYFINVFGEELMEDNVNRAIAEVCQNLDCSVEEFTIAPIFPNDQGQGSHEWLIEFHKEPKSLKVFTQQIDEALKRLNSDYEAKRSGNLSLMTPVIKAMPKGGFYKWLQSKNKLGGQHKVPRLQNHRKVIDEILATIKAR